MAIIQALSSGGTGIGLYNVTYGGTLWANNCVALSFQYGMLAQSNYVVVTSPFTAMNCTYGVLTQYAGFGWVNGVYTINCSNAGILCQLSASANVSGGLALGCGTGYQAGYNSCVIAEVAGAGLCTTGFYASLNSLIQAGSVNAYTSGKGNTTNYSPATSGAEGNTSAIVNWS